MNQQILLTILELTASLIIEGVILTMVFQMIANKQTETQQQHLQKEMEVIENQNKFDFEQIQAEIREAKAAIISQIKESEKGRR